MARKPTTFERVKSLRERFYHSLPGKESLLKIINEAEIPEHVYNSNAIENSTLSLEETEKILLDIDLERFVTVREIHEAKNLARVSAYVEDKAREKELNFDLIFLLHKMLVGNIDETIAGRLREKGEWVRVGAYVAPGPEHVQRQLGELLTAHASDNSSPIIARLARFHLEFEHIHPFCDGNGRIGRVLNNFILLREGYVPLNIAFVDRNLYYQAFKEYDTDKTSKTMEKIIGRALVQSYHKRLAYMEDKKIVSLKAYAKMGFGSYSNLLNKAGRATIEAFQEKGVWKIGLTPFPPVDTV